MAKTSVRKQPAKATAAGKPPAKAAAAGKPPAKAAAAGKPPAKAGAAPVSEPRLRAAVIGGSIAGLMASLVLYHENFEVVLYEKYPKYTRSIQWTVRQSFIDYLYSVDKDIARYLFAVKKLVSPVTNGYRYLSDKTLRFPDGSYLYKRRDGLLPEGSVASPGHDECAKPDESCTASLAEDFVGIIRASQLETHLLKQLQVRKYVKLERPAPQSVPSKEAPKCVLRDNGLYALKGDPTDYDLIVVCVGAGKSRKEFLEKGKSRDEFPAKFNPVSRQRAQVAGDVKLKRHGMVTQYQHANIDKAKKYVPFLPDGELLYSTLLSTDQDRTTCWVIGDVSTELLDNAAEEKDDNKRNELAKKECGKIAARTMLETEKAALAARIKGVVGDTVKMFVSQAKISSVAYAGNNLVLAGDAVGAGHWAVGGGMHVAGVCHQKRLETLAKKLRGDDPQSALKEYSDGAILDTMAWISESMKFYYLSIPKRVVEEVFKDVMEDFQKNNSIDAPNEMQERIISAYFGRKYDVDLKKIFPDEL